MRIPTRRRLLTATATALALPGLAHAQALPRLGVLMLPAEDDPGAAARHAALLQGLAALGWKPGETIRIETRWGAAQPERIAQQAREMVALAPNLILANGTPVINALRPLTRSIPIVCAQVIDPVGLGVVESLARPGGNITGFTFINPSLIAKWRSLLHEAAPTLQRAVLFFNPAANPWYPRALAELAATPPSPGPELQLLAINSAEALLAQLAEAARQPGTGLIIGPEPIVLSRQREVVATALAQRLPGVSVYPQFAATGGLMSYGPDVPDIFRNAAGYVDRILRGASPATLPMQQPVRFEFSLNLVTAAALGLNIPPSLLAGADTVIE
jgi:putative ABC transport system substrate-binding protein